LFAGAANQDGMKISSIAVCALLGSIINVPAGAANPVKIGVIYPLTGNAASAGASAKDAVELAAEIVNTAHPGWRVTFFDPFYLETSFVQCVLEPPQPCRLAVGHVRATG
jgi:hypothetical protein